MKGGFYFHPSNEDPLLGTPEEKATQQHGFCKH